MSLKKEAEVSAGNRPGWFNLDLEGTSNLTIQNILYGLPKGQDPVAWIIGWELMLKGSCIDRGNPEPELRAVYDLSNLPQDADQLSKATLILEALLKYKYDLSKVERCEHSKSRCHGGYNFGMTMRQVFKSTMDAKAIGSVAQVLLKIADWSSAGSCVWEMRRFIRRATADQVVEFAGLVGEMVEKFPERLAGGLFLNMDDVFWVGPSEIPDVIQGLRKRLKDYETDT